MKTKTLVQSKTVWLNLLALLMLVFPAVQAWLAVNPVALPAALGALNLLLRFLTKDAVSLFPDGTDDGGEHGQPLPAWVLLAGLAGFMGFTLPACTPGASGIPIRASYTENGVTLGYSSKSGLSVAVDQRSGK